MIAAGIVSCKLMLGNTQVIVTAAARTAAGMNAKPPITDIFAWPDGPMGVLADGSRIEFFATDGGLHKENDKSGSVTRTFGTVDNPLGTGSGEDAPIDVIVKPDLAINPNYRAYDYIGGGPVYRVPPGLPGAGQLLTVYHAERSTTGPGGFYSLLGLARSTDGGHAWTDLGEIVEPNQPYEPDLDGFDIGASRLVTDPSQTYFYVYFPDWIANGTSNPSGSATVMSVARVAIAPLLAAAFAPQPTALPPFAKNYKGRWDQPGINGLSSDLEAGSIGGDPSVAYDSYLKRYVAIADDTENISYAESRDGLSWTPRVVLRSFDSALYGAPIGEGSDPTTLGSSFYVFFTYRPNWNVATVRRFSVTCYA